MNFGAVCPRCMRESLAGGVCGFCRKAPPAAQSPEFALPLFTILHGRYLIGSVLGFGGFGVTYVAYDLAENKRVAIKEYMPGTIASRVPGTVVMSARASEEDYRYGLKQFLDEARLIYEFQGRNNIISVEKLIEDNNTAYYVMEFLEGRDLLGYLNENGGRLTLERSLVFLLPVFEALETVHAKGIVHRDVSPDNIHISRNGSVKLIDFGAARASLRDQSQSLDVILKRGYAPVEQYSSRGVRGPWTDVYALGCTLYRCLTGSVPPESVERLNGDSLVRPGALCALSPAADRAVVKAMSVREKDRFQTVGEFRRALVGGETPSVPSRPREEGSGGSGAAWGVRCDEGGFAGCFFPIGDRKVVIGRDPARCAIAFSPDTPGVSAVHCELRLNMVKTALVVTDLGSTYGTKVEGGQTLTVGMARALSDGERFAVGENLFTVVIKRER